MIFALLQLRKGLINLGSLSLRRPSTGLRNTATKSELEVSGAKSPTKMLYSLGYCCTPVACAPFVAGKGVYMGEVGPKEEAQFMTKGFAELGMGTGAPFTLLEIWVSTEAAWAGDGKVRKQYPGLLACWPVVASGAGWGTLILTGSQPMRLQTCLAYSSSIQGSKSPHQIVERDAREFWGKCSWLCA